MGGERGRTGPKPKKNSGGWAGREPLPSRWGCTQLITCLFTVLSALGWAPWHT